MGPLARRLAFAPVVVLAVTALIYGTLRVLRPDLYPGEALPAGVLRDLDRIVLHFDFGCAADWPGCPPITTLWGRAWIWDLWLLGGAMLIGLGGGWVAGIWCAARPRSVSARLLEGAAMVLYCIPVYVVGMVILKLFNSTYGIVPLPAFFDADPASATPWGDPWDWFRAMLMPWLVLAAPLGAMVLRLTLGHTLEAMGEDFVRTGVGKGLTHHRVVARHAGPVSLVRRWRCGRRCSSSG